MRGIESCRSEVLVPNPALGTLVASLGVLDIVEIIVYGEYDVARWKV